MALLAISLTLCHGFYHISRPSSMSIASYVPVIAYLCLDQLQIQRQRQRQRRDKEIGTRPRRVFHQPQIARLPETTMRRRILDVIGLVNHSPMADQKPNLSNRASPKGCAIG
ncbi:Nuclear transcription factor Y subunit B [Fusarium oxysporum f. sp. albedinis]|nr:Nuclear transcription factor Y subunit B [Fusarium oxysporum f. sp. albedinis]